MNISLYIAKRYLFAKRKQNVVQLISLISLIGVGIGTMALIIVLSVLNGFNALSLSLFNTFDPPLLIEATEGKTFYLKDFPEEKVRDLKEITHFIPCVQENALLTCKQNQLIVTLKGVEPDYEQMSGIDKYMVGGRFLLENNGADFAVLGGQIDQTLGISHTALSNTPIKAHVPKRTQNFSLQVEESANAGVLLPAGAFMISADIDNQYVLTNTNFVRRLLDYKDDEVTSIELGISNNKKAENIQQKVQKIVGEKYNVKTRFQQQAVFYQTVKIERLAIYLIMSFIIFIASFNIVGSLSLLMLDKKKDVKTLKSIGANKQLVTKIFFTEGMLISLIGAFAGLIVGGIICYLQQKFGFISMGDNFVISAFPVKIQTLDFVFVFLLTLAIGAFSVGVTVFSRIKKVYY